MTVISLNFNSESFQIELGIWRRNISGFISMEIREHDVQLEGEMTDAHRLKIVTTQKKRASNIPKADKACTSCRKSHVSCGAGM
jgi:hypothetical protein